MKTCQDKNETQKSNNIKQKINQKGKTENESKIFKREERIVQTKRKNKLKNTRRKNITRQTINKTQKKNAGTPNKEIIKREQ